MFLLWRALLWLIVCLAVLTIARGRERKSFSLTADVGLDDHRVRPRLIFSLPRSLQQHQQQQQQQKQLETVIPHLQEQLQFIMVQQSQVLQQLNGLNSGSSSSHGGAAIASQVKNPLLLLLLLLHDLFRPTVFLCKNYYSELLRSDRSFSFPTVTESLCLPVNYLPFSLFFSFVIAVLPEWCTAATMLIPRGNTLVTSLLIFVLVAADVLYRGAIYYGSSLQIFEKS